MAERLQDAIERARREREGAIGLTRTPHNYLPTGVAAETAADLFDLTSPEQTDAADPAASVESPVANGAQTASPVNARQESRNTISVDYLTTRQAPVFADVLRQNRVIAGDIHDPQVSAYRQLRSQVLEIMRRNQLRTLAVTSAREGAGKTLTCINLAICIAKDVNQTVLLVDLDLSKPDVASTLGVEVDKGIVDHIVGGEPLENILLNPQFPRLVILPGKPQGKPVSELLSSPEFKDFLADITTRYRDRLIIYDLPPLLRNDDAMVFMPNADACLFVVEDGVTRPEELETCFQLLKHSKLAGTVLNKAR